MKTLLFIFVISSATLGFADGQNLEDLKNVDKLVVSSGIRIDYVQSEKHALELSSEDLNIECLTHTIEGSTLILKLKGNIDCRGQVQASLSLPALKEIELMGKAEFNANKVIKLDSLKVVQRSGSSSYLSLDIKYLECTLSEGSLMRAEGYAVKQKLEVSTRASFSAFKLIGQELDVLCSMGGKAKVCSEEQLTAKAKSGGYVSYRCSPEKTTFSSSSRGVIEESQE